MCSHQVEQKDRLIPSFGGVLYPSIWTQRRERPISVYLSAAGERKTCSGTAAVLGEVHPFQGSICFKAGGVKHFNHITHSICSNATFILHPSDYTLAF